MPNLPDFDYVSDGVYIGGARATLYMPALRQAGITAVLKLYFHDPYWPDDFTVCENPFNDGEYVSAEQMRRGVTFIRAQVQAQRTLPTRHMDGPK